MHNQANIHFGSACQELQEKEDGRNSKRVVAKVHVLQRGHRQQVINDEYMCKGRERERESNMAREKKTNTDRDSDRGREHRRDSDGERECVYMCLCMCT